MDNPQRHNPLADTPRFGVSEELIAQLHDATSRFHEARRRLEEQMDGVEHRHQERVDIAGAEVRRIEREIEDLSAKIHNALPPV